MQEVTNVQRLSNRVAGLKPSGIRKFFDIAATMKDVISLGIGEPDFTTPKPILEAGIRSLQEGNTHYTSNWGTLELRQAISNNLQRLYQLQYDPTNEIVATVGGSEALYLAFTAILNEGDEVIIPTPCFVSYQAEVILAGGVPVEVVCRKENQFVVDPDDIRKAITPRTKMILVGYPSNPTGAVATRETMTEIAKIAEEFNLIVVTDELYDRLVYGFQHVSFPSVSESAKQRTILINGFSKSYAMTGWRIGYACGPADLIQGLVRIHQYSVMSAPTTAQDAGLVALQIGDPHIEEMRLEYDRRRQLLVTGLNRLGLSTFEPRGAFYAFPDVRSSGMDDETFAETLLREEHVAVVPGSAFGPGGEGFTRMCYATEYSKIEEALHRMEKFMSRHG
ncbi:MAG: pyridoxal phosphate-dependent aminotransferase [Anaerolineaceae bacterium]|nr:pyridoxal phosphate-dependent aminotransferase [Anaerolineaceae bacterium]OQY90055.1 MAG: aromatic amino acid aminotransferase [Anaerolineae bacterium UTCFX1]